MNLNSVFDQGTTEEQKAKRGAYALMMPYDFIKSEVSQRLSNCCVSFHQGSRMDVVGRGIAKEFDIPKAIPHRKHLSRIIEKVI